MGLITIVCHHGGSFVTSEDGVISYTRNHISEIPKLDLDRLDVFFIRNYYKELGPLETGLRELNSDAELLEMCFLAESNHGEMHVYYEHGVSIPTYLEEPPFKKGKKVVVEVPTQPVLLRTGPSSRAIPPHPVPSPCINHPKTTESTQEATSTIPNPISMAATPAPPNQEMDHTQVPAATTKSTPIPKSTILNPISMAATPAPPNQDIDHTQIPTATTKSTPIPKSTPTPVPKPKQGKIFQPKVPSKNGTEKKGAALKKTAKKGEPRTTLNRRYITRGLAKGHVTRQITKGKGKQVDTIVLSESETSDSYESIEDSAYKPGAGDSSSDEEVTNTILKAKRKEVNRKHLKKVKLSKLWKEILQPNDGLVPEDDSGEDDELFFVPTANHSPNIGGYDAHDEYHDESDGADSWHSKEMKTPPNSEDEFAEVEDDDAFPVFKEGTRFGELRLEVGMKFNMKMDFKEAVREYCIQEGRRVRFKKNDNVRCRVLCKGKDCPWVIYASKNSEDVCWQVKTFNEDHTFPRKTKNRLANRGWLASKLVKKLRKFSNLKHSKALTYFKSKYNDTYAFHINPIPGQKLWEKSLYNRPQTPKFKKMPGAPKKKQRKEADKRPVGGKKQKITKMKRVYKEGSWRHCGGKGHEMLVLEP
ncbi:hypothetical protein Ahy_B08g089993 [Arachis hypogaea]|uniref:Uncharacterized protein n=1 Tax=Arachis hypogaea TaxID=3818 RepID=A0A444XZB7_ARAHY|nr:hypothetical protein Ahy_B08g089993 [Arachis hypogaea]